MQTVWELRRLRRQRLDVWLSAQAWNLDEYPFWSQGKKDTEAAAFSGFDALFETEKAVLGDTLLGLTAEALNAYFQGIGFEPVGETSAEMVEDYLARG